MELKVQFIITITLSLLCPPISFTPDDRWTLDSRLT